MWVRGNCGVVIGYPLVGVLMAVVVSRVVARHYGLVPLLRFSQPSRWFTLSWRQHLPSMLHLAQWAICIC